jgi:hypothetical protein
MRYVTLALLCLLSLQGKLLAQDQGKKNPNSNPQTGVQASADTIPILEMDGTTLHIVGFGNIFINYTETIDGYTVVLDDAGLYEYAKATKEGDLIPTGMLARDPQNRTKKEMRKLRKMPQHLRYQGEVLEKMTRKQQNFEEDTKRQ